MYTSQTRANLYSNIKLFYASLLMMICILFISPNAHATYPGDNGVITYQKTDGKYYTSNPDTSNEQPVPWGNGNYNGGAIFSPDGKKVVYQNGNYINTAKINGDNIITVNHDSPNSQFLGWSKDGLGYHFSSCYTFEQTQCSVHSYNLGLDIYRNTSKSTNSTQIRSVSPDGLSGAYIDSYSKPTKLVIKKNLLSSDESSQSQQTFVSGSQYGMQGSLNCLSWSPDSTKIATWEQTSVNGILKLLIIDSNDGEVIKSFDVSGFSYCPVWSPDGKSIIFGTNKLIRPASLTNPERDDALIKIDYASGSESRVANDVLTVNDWQALPVSKDTTSTYRFWSDTYKHHFYTASYDEAYDVAQNYPTTTWKYEKVAYSVPKSCDLASPVYRFWSDAYKGHFFTISKSEKEQVQEFYPLSTWRYESVAYCAHTTNASGRQPLYRFWSDAYKGHFFTKDSSEKDYVIANYPSSTWRYEGVAYYVE